jgi:hypothetical protein
LFEIGIFMNCSHFYVEEQTCESTNKTQKKCPEHKASVPHMLITEEHHAKEQEDNGITC